LALDEKMLSPDKIGLIGFVVIFILSFALHDIGGSRSPKYRDLEKEPRRPPVTGLSEDRRPSITSPGPILPPISPRDPTLQLMPSAKGNSTGTAFSIGQGIWMTARHVLEGCKKYGIFVGKGRVARGYERVLNPYHDLATFKTKPGGPSFSFAKGELRFGQNAYHFGYPQGKPAALHSTLLGRVNISPGRKSRHKEPVIAWAEVRRVPKFSGSLGGISGGPVLDSEGTIIGVSVVESRRRGRIFTAAPRGMQDMLRRGRVELSSVKGAKIREKINSMQFADIGQRLRKRRSVSKVVCWVD